MSLHFVPGCDWRLLTPQVCLALTVASECYAEEGEDCLVTGLTRHKSGVPHGGIEDFAANGYHSRGQAADLAVRRYRGGEPIPTDKMDRIVARLQQRLGRVGGGQFDVVDERGTGASANWTGPHIHLEWDPK